MKRYCRFLIHLLVPAALSVSCIDEPALRERADQGGGDRAATFVTGFAPPRADTRVSGSNWQQADEVGIYMLPHNAQAGAEADFTQADELNVLYKAATAGATTALVADDRQIIFPKGRDVNFLAYYPYRSTMSSGDGEVYPVDVSNQSPHAAIDLIYHNGVGTAYNEKQPVVELEFLHALSKIVVNVVPEDAEVEVDLSTTTATLSGFPTQAKFSLANGQFSAVGTVQSLTPLTGSRSATTATFEAIVVPHKGEGEGGGSAYERKILLNIEGKDYTYTLPPSWEMEPGVAASYVFKFTGASLVLSYNHIVDWDGGQIAWGDYLLAADRTQIVLRETASQGNTFKLSTTAPTRPTAERSNAPGEITPTKPDWITGINLTADGNSGGGNSGEWTTYTLSFDVSGLPQGVKERIGYIHLKVEGLVLVVKVIQQDLHAIIDDATIGQWDDEVIDNGQWTIENEI